jgi:hypothetical protein
MRPPANHRLLSEALNGLIIHATYHCALPRSLRKRWRAARSQHRDRAMFKTSA